MSVEMIIDIIVAICFLFAGFACGWMLRDYMQKR